MNNILQNENNKYNYSIDASKGVLILLVIIGHVLIGNLQDHFIRFFIYSFHMPLFLFISGYLININKLEKYSFTTLVKHYLKRMLGWWLLACLIYYIITNRTYSLESFISHIIHPYYHLWYIPSLFCMILISYFVSKKKKKIYLLFGLSISCFLIYIFFNFHE